MRRQKTQQRRLVGLDDDLRKAYEDFLRRVRAGEAPRDAVTAVMERFAGAMADTLAAAFGAILAAFDTGIGTGSTTMGWIIGKYGFASAFGACMRVMPCVVLSVG